MSDKRIPKIRISEIFGPTIQGEGVLIGQPTVFVRTAGCDYRCDWCDTPYAVGSRYRFNWQAMTCDEIFAEIEKLTGGEPLVVTLSGGNPAIPPLGDLIELGKAKGYSFAIETQGSIVRPWFADLDVLTLSPKPPSSYMETDWDKLDASVAAAGPDTQVSMKIVIFDDADYDYAKKVGARYPDLPLYLQPCNHTPHLGWGVNADQDPDMTGIMDRMRWLVDKVVEDRWFNATVLPQLHVMIWGGKSGV